MTDIPHKDLREQYGKDMLVYAGPWKKWQKWSMSLDRWEDCTSPPAFVKLVKYRRIPDTIKIGDFDVLEPLREAPEVGTRVYYPDLYPATYKYGGVVWRGKEQHYSLLKLGILHLTPEAATQHAKALLSFAEVE